MASDYPAAFAALREILKRHSDGLVVQADTPGEFVVITRAIGPNGKPMWFGAVTSKKSAVTYHLMPLYFNPKLQSAIAPELLPRKQGKTCFNFQRPDAALFEKLDALTRLARETWHRAGFLDEGPVAPERFDQALRAGGEDPERIAKVRKAKGQAAAKKRAKTMRAKGRSK